MKYAFIISKYNYKNIESIKKYLIHFNKINKTVQISLSFFIIVKLSLMLVEESKKGIR